MLYIDIDTYETGIQERKTHLLKPWMHGELVDQYAGWSNYTHITLLRVEC